jgi:hypothetical protein
MPFTPGRRGSGNQAAPRLRLRASHSGRIRLRVSHRGGAWQPPGKDDDALYERDLLPHALRDRRE